MPDAHARHAAPARGGTRSNPLAGGMGLTICGASPTIPAVKHTCVSWEMCMPWRPRRAEDGV